MDNVCNRRLFSFPAKVEMAEEQEYLWVEDRNTWMNRPFQNSSGNWGEFQILTNR